MLTGSAGTAARAEAKIDRGGGGGRGGVLAARAGAAEAAEAKERAKGEGGGKRVKGEEGGERVCEGLRGVQLVHAGGMLTGAVRLNPSAVERRWYMY